MPKGKPQSVPGVGSRRVHVFWNGRVQGVGFRYTAEAAALDLGITGWVRNLPDGRVEAVGEGSEKKLGLFLERIASGPMRHYIQQAQVRWEDPTGEFQEFQVRFY